VFSVIEKIISSLRMKLQGAPKVIGEFLYGLLFHEMDLEMKKERGHLDDLFMLITFGELVGLPLLPPYYAMRLLPHIMPSLHKWQRRILREKDLTDFVGQDL
jgi:hypothetical protein